MDVLRAQRDFLVNCSESLILEHGRHTSPIKNATDLQDVLVVSLSGLLLKNLDQLGHCKTLKICVLSDNFLTRIEPLIECVHLVKLDLRGNQITHLPSASFWSNLKDLQLLNLHDNSIVERRNIIALSGCPKLTALTLYDTPLSLKPNYRHCVVNTVWTLKALDKHIISDEEIVQNWLLPPKFKTMSAQFGVNLYPSLKTDSYKTEMKALQGLIAVINRVQANYCPILIVQKWIRGYLTRRNLGLCRSPLPRSGSQKQGTPRLTPRPPETTKGSWIKECRTDQLDLQLEQRESAMKRLWVNLRKQEKPQELLSEEWFDSSLLKELRMPCNTPEQSQGIATPSRRVNPAVTDVDHTEADEEPFHLFGFKATVHSSEPFAEMLASRKVLGQEVREAISVFHSRKPERPRCPQPQPRNITAEKRFIVRCHDFFSLVPFRAIDRAYQMNKKAEDLEERRERVAQLQGRRDDARGRRDHFLVARWSDALLLEDREKAELEKKLSLQRNRCQEEIEFARQRHFSFLEEKRRRLQVQQMVVHFSGQHSFLNKAITRQCIQQRLSNSQHERRRRVAVSKQHTQDQKLHIQQYLENRKQKIHADVLRSRASVHSVLSEREHLELLAAQARVAHVKSSHYEVEVLHPVPPTHPPNQKA
ncbi:leucine-rich repeat and IQ domain-containing protein 3 [Hoplias malabaricus]|uniref:leucine-rich repeat and IQ domain-containing protein 3 n=1 Tax=Hoplias malabaricus TaxID=27720 RepID=UPI003462809A